MFDLGADLSKPSLHRRSDSGPRLCFHLHNRNPAASASRFLRLLEITSVAASRATIFADQIVHCLGVMHAALSQARRVHEAACRINYGVGLNEEVPEACYAVTFL